MISLALELVPEGETLLLDLEREALKALKDRIDAAQEQLVKKMEEVEKKAWKDLSVEDRQWFADAFSGAGVEVDPESIIPKKPA